MIPRKKMMANLGVGLGTMLQLVIIIGINFSDKGIDFSDKEHHSIVIFLCLLSVPIFIWGCMHYAESKGHSKVVGFLGIASIIGLIVLIVLPDLTLNASIPRQLWRKVIGLICLVLGLGVAVLGLWLDSLGVDIRLERKLQPWPGVCMLAGALLAVVSLPVLVGNTQR